MKCFYTFSSLALFVFVIGCASSGLQTRTNAPDGIYMEATGNGPSYEMLVTPPGGRAKTFHIEEYVKFIPATLVVFDSPEGCYVQIDGRVVGEDWAEDGIFFVINHKAYSGLAKSGQPTAATGERFGPSATISQVLPTREEANAVASALRRRYPWLSP